MSNIDLPEGAGRVDTFTRDDAGTPVHMQAIVPVDPVTGDPLDLATQSTLVALATAVGTLNTAAAAIKAAVEALNGKTSTVDTSSIAGIVALDGSTLAALESINANTGLVQPLTDTQLRASAVPVSGTLALDAPTLAALETTNIAGTVTVSGPLTDAQLRDTPVPVSGSISAEVTPDTTVAMQRLLNLMANPMWVDAITGRMRVVLDPLGGAQTLGSVTTVGTVSNITAGTITTVQSLTNAASIGGIKADSLIYDAMHAAWAQAIRPRIG